VENRSFFRPKLPQHCHSFTKLIMSRVVPTCSICKHCGAWKRISELCRCSSCAEVYYCSKTHLSADWATPGIEKATGHKAICRHVRQDPTCIAIEVASGEGSGLGNRMINHLFHNKQDALHFIYDKFNGKVGYPIKSQFAEILGWSLEIYASARCNSFEPSSKQVTRGPDAEPILNGAGVYLGCAIHDGLSVCSQLNGIIYVIGRRYKDGKPLVSDSLWCLLNFIWDSMDFYEMGGDAVPDVMQLAQRYHAGEWEPSGGSCGANANETDPKKCRVWRALEIHDSPSPACESITATTNSNTKHRIVVTQSSGGNFEATETVASAQNDSELETMAEEFAASLVIALRQDIFPSKETECVFGIDINSGSQPLLSNIREFSTGSLIYYAWQEIYKRHLFHCGETIYDRPPGPAALQFEADLIQCIREWTLPQKFEEWTKEVVLDEAFRAKAYSTEMVRRGFATDQGLINPHSEMHRNMRRMFLSSRNR
jgi:hypothetical protein